jgi:hypothetical protein
VTDQAVGDDVVCIFNSQVSTDVFIPTQRVNLVSAICRSCMGNLYPELAKEYLLHGQYKPGH